MLFCVIFVDFLNVACLNEFFVYLIYLIIDIPPIRVVILDFIYAVIFPMNILCLGKKLHELNLWNEMSLCPRSLCRDEGEDDKVKITNMNASFGNNIIAPCYTLCNKRKMCPFEYNCISFFSFFLPVCFFFLLECLSCLSLYLSKYEDLLKSLAFLSSFVFCLRPIISSFTFLLRSFTY